MTGTIINFRIERLARRAPDAPPAISDDDRAYIHRHLDAIAEAFDVKTVPDVSLTILPARALVRHLAGLRATLKPAGMEQRIALGRLESVLRLVESAVQVMIDRGSRRSA